MKFCCVHLYTPCLCEVHIKEGTVSQLRNKFEHRLNTPSFEEKYKEMQCFYQLDPTVKKIVLLYEKMLY